MSLFAKVIIRSLLTSPGLNSDPTTGLSPSLPEIVHSTLSTSFDSTFIRINQTPTNIRARVTQEESIGIILSNIRYAQELLRSVIKTSQPVNPVSSSGSALYTPKPSYPFVNANFAPFTTRDYNTLTALPTVTPKPVYLKGRSN